MYIPSSRIGIGFSGVIMVNINQYLQAEGEHEGRKQLSNVKQNSLRVDRPFQKWQWVHTVKVLNVAELCT